MSIKEPEILTVEFHCNHKLHNNRILAEAWLTRNNYIWLINSYWSINGNNRTNEFIKCYFYKLIELSKYNV